MLPQPRPSTPELDLRRLFQLSRLMRETDLALTERITALLELLQEFVLSPPKGWDSESLARARHFAEEVTVLYVSWFHDPSRIPVTFYKRERWVRRHLDAQFSALFREIQRRVFGEPHERELITQEPIYWLTQKAREKSFPKGPKSQGRRPNLETLRIRFHAALAQRLDPETGGDRDRRVPLPHEI